MNARLVPLVVLAFFLKCEVNAPIDSVPRASTLTVIVTDARSHPVSGATVYLNGTGSMGVLGPAWLETTDANGRCRFDDLEAVPYLVFGGQPSGTAAARTVTIPRWPASPVDLQLALAPAATLRGRVLVQGATDHAGTLTTTLGLVAADTTEGDGAFLLRAIPVGTWRVVASRPGFASQEIVAEVASPGDTVTLPDLVLLPVPGP